MTRNRYFVDTGDGVEYYESRSDAEEAAFNAIVAWRETDDSEWPEEVEHVCWGVVIQRATGNELTGGQIDYKLQFIPEQP